jgi:hypothetical protein
LVWMRGARCGGSGSCAHMGASMGPRQAARAAATRRTCLQLAVRSRQCLSRIKNNWHPINFPCGSGTQCTALRGIYKQPRPTSVHRPSSLLSVVVVVGIFWCPTCGRSEVRGMRRAMRVSSQTRQDGCDYGCLLKKTTGVVVAGAQLACRPCRLTWRLAVPLPACRGTVNRCRLPWLTESSRRRRGALQACQRGGGFPELALSSLAAPAGS